MFVLVVRLSLSPTRRRIRDLIKGYCNSLDDSKEAATHPAPWRERGYYAIIVTWHKSDCCENLRLRMKANSTQTLVLMRSKERRNPAYHWGLIINVLLSCCLCSSILLVLFWKCCSLDNVGVVVGSRIAFNLFLMNEASGWRLMKFRLDCQSHGIVPLSGCKTRDSWKGCFQAWVNLLVLFVR